MKVGSDFDEKIGVDSVLFMGEGGGDFGSLCSYTDYQTLTEGN